MIISHKYRCIFVKTAKTAGSSIEVFLSKACGMEDVVTPLTPKEQGHQPRNFRGFFNPLPELISGRGAMWKRTLSNFRDRAKFYSHLHARLSCHRVGPDIWNSYFKFCIERNPWDKSLSHYHMVNTLRGGGLEFDAYLKKGKFCLNTQYYLDFDEKTLLVDRVLDYHCLDQQLTEVCAKLEIPFSGSLQEKSKANLRPDRRHYREVYSSEQAEIIARAYSQEIQMHGYTY